MNFKEIFDADRIMANYAKQMDMISEEIGVKVNHDAVLVDYAKTLGKSVYELTDLEKHEAMCSALLKKKEGK